MTYRCLLAALLSGVLLLSLSACDDSSTVGLGVGPDSLQGGRPVTLSTPTTTFETFTETDVTSQVALTSGAAPSNGHRILTGTVDDPMVGTMQTRGHIDFRQPESLQQPQSGVADSVNLLLEVEYRYGDTTGTQTIDIREAAGRDVAEIDTSWEADRDVPFGDVITSLDVGYRDTTVTVKMPQDWVEANSSSFFSTASSDDPNSFNLQFQGLVLTSSSGNRVTGFDREASALQVFYQPAQGATLTARFDGAKSFTFIDRVMEATPPSGNSLLLDGIGTGLRTNFDFAGRSWYPDTNFGGSADSLGVAPINRAELVLPIDSAVVSQLTPSDFVRPPVEGLFLRAPVLDSLQRETRTGEQVLCASLGLQTTIESSCLIPLARTEVGIGAPNSSVRPILQEALTTGSSLFKRYTLEISAGEPTVTPLLIGNPSNSDNQTRPRIQATVVPQE